MKLIRIKDLSPKGFLAFDLRDILNLIEDINQYYWKASDIWATGNEDGELEKNEIISSEQLKQWANRISQVIDGNFEGYLKVNNEKSVVIKAIDSSYYEVYSVDEKLLEKIKENFMDTEIIENV